MKKKLSILIVDDHQAMLSTLEDILMEEGYNVKSVSSGEMAIEVCAENQFDIILMDVRMPDLDGVETYRCLKENAIMSRVIMMSAYSIDELKKEALDEGVAAFLEKPVDIERVLKLIRNSAHPPVLLVMNEESECGELAAFLKKNHYYTYIAGNAEEALDLARQIRFHVIMIDIHLQASDALVLYLALKEITPTSRIILLAETDDCVIKEAEEVVKHSEYTFLTKPLDLERLYATLDTIQRQMDSDFFEKPGE